MTTKATERDLVDEVEELLAGVPERLYDIPHPSLRIAEHRIASRPDAFWHAPVHVATVRSEDLAALFARSPELLRRLVEENKRISNAFLIAFDLAGIDTHPLPEALPESAYVDGYMDKVRELRAVFALIAARVKKENPDA